MVRYDIRRGVRKIKTKMVLVISGIGIGVAGLAMAFALPFAANAAAAIQNGSFENGTVGGPYMQLNAVNNSDLTGWSVSSGNVDVIDGYWVSQDGHRSIDLNGLNPGSISQTLDTMPGHTYTVSFYMSGNPDGGPFGSPAIKTMDVDVNNSQVQQFSFDTTTHTVASMGWELKTYTFTAPGLTSILAFHSTTIAGTQWFGPAIDNVTITDTTTKEQCKNGGWMNLQDKNGKPFKNQGDCVSYFATNGKNLANGSI